MNRQPALNCPVDHTINRTINRTMSANRLLAATALSILFAACSSAPSLQGEPAPDHLEKGKQGKVLDAKRRDFHQVLVQLDQGIESYVAALANRGDQRADHQIDQLGKLLQDVVLDLKARRLDGTTKATDHNPGENFRTLRALALDGTYPDQQAIALAALGFSGRNDVMEDILQGARLSDAFVVDHAVLGLAVLKAPKTPPGVLAAIAEDPQHPLDGRVQAAWALYQVQTACIDHSEFVKIWNRYVGADGKDLPDGILVNAIRGLGLAGESSNAAGVVPMLRHPTPRIRMAAAVALGRMNAQQYWKELLELLRPQESVQNVRLSARKSLARLAGNNDYGYDVSAWQKVFERDSQ